MALACERSQGGEPRSRASGGVQSVWGRLQSSGGHRTGDQRRSRAEVDCGVLLSHWSGRYVTGVANRGLAIALEAPMEMEREQLGGMEAGVAGLSRKNT